MLIKVAKYSLIIIIPFMIALSSYLLIGRPNAVYASGERSYSWGLSHRGNGFPPDATGGDLLTDNGGVYLGATSSESDKKTVYLTFDLGYEAGFTPAVLDTLKANNIKAIFFLCGHYLGETALVERMIADGHIIGNHTNKHKDLPSISKESVERDIDEFTALYEQKYQAPVKHFRPPGGRFNKTTLDVATSRGLKPVMWSLAIVDWGKTEINPQASAKKICSRVHDGAIVLLHISNGGTPKMLDLLVPMLVDMGYVFGDATGL